jgi:hypothetical protein
VREPRTAHRYTATSMLIYDSTLPNVMAVVTNDPRKHLGTLVVRYYDPAGGTK